MRTASWVIKERESGKAVLETFNEDLKAAVNQSKYEIVPILDYLQSLNQK